MDTFSGVPSVGGKTVHFDPESIGNNQMVLRKRISDYWESEQWTKTAFMVLSLALLFVIQWHRVFLGHEIPMDGNTFRFFYPSWAIGRKLMLSGQSLLWDPYRNMGQPFLAHPQNQALYPFRFFILPFDFLNYVRVFLIFHYSILSFFSYRLLKFWGSDRQTSFVSIIMMLLGGFLVARIPDQSDVATFCWIPAVMYFFAREKPVPLALSLSMQWLSGFPPFFVLTYLLISFSGVWDADRRRKFMCLGSATLLFLGLVAVQWIPFLEFLLNSTRPLLLGPKMLLEYSVHPLELIRGFFIPSLFQNHFPLMENSDPAVVGFFLGPIQMILFAIGVIGSHRRVKILALVAVLGAFMALGKYNGVYEHLPFIGLFRFPAQWIIFPVICVPLVAANGFSKIKSRFLKFLVLFLILLDGLIFSWNPQSLWIDSNFAKYDPIKLVRSVHPNGPRVLYSPPLMADSYRWKMSGSRAWINFLAIKPPSMLAAEGVREVFSHSNLQSRANHIFQEKMAAVSLDSPLLKTAGVALTVCLRPGAERLTPPPSEDVGLVWNPYFNSHAFVVEGHPSTVLIDRPGKMHVRSEGPGLLVFSECFFPGWKAKIDGQNIKICAYDDVFLSVPLPSGEHQVEFEYCPPFFFLGLWISIITCVVIVSYRIRHFLLRSKNMQ